MSEELSRTPILSCRIMAREFDKIVGFNIIKSYGKRFQRIN